VRIGGADRRVSSLNDATAGEERDASAEEFFMSHSGAVFDENMNSPFEGGCRGMSRRYDPGHPSQPDGCCPPRGDFQGSRRLVIRCCVGSDSLELSGFSWPIFSDGV